jgi:hypothetical protein
VRVTIEDQVLERELIVLKDPSSVGTQADIEAQLELQLQIREATDSTVRLIDRIELVREQLGGLSTRLAEQATSPELVAEAHAIDQALSALENGLFDLRLSGGLSRQDSLRWPRQLYAKLTSLSGYVAGADYRPTDQHLEVFAEYQARLEAAQAEMRRIEQEDLARLNERLRQGGVGPVVTQ